MTTIIISLINILFIVCFFSTVILISDMAIGVIANSTRKIYYLLKAKPKYNRLRARSWSYRKPLELE